MFALCYGLANVDFMLLSIGLVLCYSALPFKIISYHHMLEMIYGQLIKNTFDYPY